MRQKVCAFLSSSAGLTAAILIVMGLIAPIDWLQKAIFVGLVTPVIVIATSRFFGVAPLWKPTCSKPKDGDGTRTG
ncbi:hypothetical protein [Microbacterium sp. SSM24]|uniref:hypothetical protein n=1 Tax=Microbacterium sp. SSM24 TaxID=2991714 RepID=UPI002227FC72|nr:hypothetical protein [Microbacterium sp. SSM24]MCW3492387.1 hypothetical protein [Microbacterium sp. SSM24]